MFHLYCLYLLIFNISILLKEFCFFFPHQSVATIGSTLTSVQHDVKTMQAALENQKKDDDLKKTMVMLFKQLIILF